MLKQSLNNGNIKHKVESGVVSFSRKDAERIVYEIDKLIESEYEDATEAYKEYFFEYGDFDRYGKPIENEMTKRFQKKLLEELKTKENFAHDLARKMAIAIRDNYNDRSMDEAYVDQSGQLQDFDFFPYNIDISDDKWALYNPSLPKRNRMKAPDGGVYLELIVSDPYQKEVLQKVLKIAVDKGKNMPDLGGVQKLGSIKYRTFGDTLKVQFSNKVYQLILDTLEEVRKEDEDKFIKMQDDAYDMSPEEKRDQLRTFNTIFDTIKNSII
jgi:hypothetical protein